MVVTNLIDLLPAWKRWLGHLFDKVPTGKVDSDPRVHRFNQLIRHAPPADSPNIDPAVDLSMMYSGSPPRQSLRAR